MGPDTPCGSILHIGNYDVPYGLENKCLKLQKFRAARDERRDREAASTPMMTYSGVGLYDVDALLMDVGVTSESVLTYHGLGKRRFFKCAKEGNMRVYVSITHDSTSVAFDVDPDTTVGELTVMVSNALS